MTDIYITPIPCDFVVKECYDSWTMTQYDIHNEGGNEVFKIRIIAAIIAG